MAGRIGVRPSWWDPQDGLIDVVVDPGRAFGTGGHPTTRLCLALLIELETAGEASGPIADWGTGSGVLAIAAAKLGWSPVTGCDREEASLETAQANAVANGVELALERLDVRETAPPVAPTVVANLTGNLLRDCARHLVAREDCRGRWSARGCWRARSTKSPSAFAGLGLGRGPADDRARVGRAAPARRAGRLMAAETSTELPIAMFDSGVGGLTVLHECLVSLPEEDYVYLGDDARFPYGARTQGRAPRPCRAGEPLSAGARGEAAGDRLQLGRVGGPGGRQGDRGARRASGS